MPNGKRAFCSKADVANITSGIKLSENQLQDFNPE